MLDKSISIIIELKNESLGNLIWKRMLQQHQRPKPVVGINLDHKMNDIIVHIEDFLDVFNSPKYEHQVFS